MLPQRALCIDLSDHIQPGQPGQIKILRPKRDPGALALRTTYKVSLLTTVEAATVTGQQTRSNLSLFLPIAMLRVS